MIMIINDRIYGSVEISEPVLVELIKCASLQRLKGVDQAGYFEPWFPGTAHSRFEHSLGVCLLLRRYGASIAEQAAGLIHDVSHSAFSHTIDYVLDSGSEKKHDHQDNFFAEFVLKSEIPAILAKHGLEPSFILDDRNFPLKERNLPDLCADRIDYALRELVVYREIDSADIFLENLVVANGYWIFKDFKTAKIFAEYFSKLNRDYFSDLNTAIMFRTTGDYLRHSLKNNYISTDDLYTTDSQVLAKVAPYHQSDPELSKLFKRMNNQSRVTNNPDDFDAIVYCKSRVVDPLCRHKGRLRRVSQVDGTWKKILLQELKPKKYFLKFAD